MKHIYNKYIYITNIFIYYIQILYIVHIQETYPKSVWDPSTPTFPMDFRPNMTKYVHSEPFRGARVPKPGLLKWHA